MLRFMCVSVAFACAVFATSCSDRKSGNNNTSDKTNQPTVSSSKNWSQAQLTSAIQECRTKSERSKIVDDATNNAEIQHFCDCTVEKISNLVTFDERQRMTDDERNAKIDTVKGRATCTASALAEKSPHPTAKMQKGRWTERQFAELVSGCSESKANCECLYQKLAGIYGFVDFTHGALTKDPSVTARLTQSMNACLTPQS